MPVRDDSGPRRRELSQRWATFVRNHAKAVVAADFFNVVTVHFRVLYVYVVMEVGTRKTLHFNVTRNPSAAWTLQQFREAIPCEHDYRFVIVDRDGKFSEDLRRTIGAMGVRVLRTPRMAPQANSYCVRLIGATRRECLDFLIPMSESHLRRLLSEWRDYYNCARPHSSLGPGLPDGSVNPRAKPADHHRHRLPNAHGVVSRPILGRLHHDYQLADAA